MKSQAEGLFGPEIAGQMGDFWGLDEEGELRGAFKRCGRKCHLALNKESTLTLYRSCAFLSWWYSRPCPLLLEVHCFANQSGTAGNSFATIPDDTKIFAS